MFEINKNIKLAVLLLVVIALVALEIGVIGTLFFSVFSANQQIRVLSNKLGLTEKRLNGLGNQLKTVAEQSNENLSQTEEVIRKNSALSEEIARRDNIIEKSQEELLTQAVAKSVPSVVSIVVDKDVPKLEIVYENPFGNDPFFKDFNILVPRFRQKGTESQRVGAGTGFLITSDGCILTNKHVVEDTQARYTVLLTDGFQKSAQVIYRDNNIDIAMLKIEGSNFKKVELGDSDELRLGHSVFAIGNALGEYNNSVSVGIVSGLNRTIEAAGSSGVEKLNGVIQTDAAINPGNSGGPLLNLQGKVVGINVAMVKGSENIGFAIPINTVKQTINSVLKLKL